MQAKTLLHPRQVNKYVEQQRRGSQGALDGGDRRMASVEADLPGAWGSGGLTGEWGGRGVGRFNGLSGETGGARWSLACFAG